MQALAFVSMAAKEQIQKLLEAEAPPVFSNRQRVVDDFRLEGMNELVDFSPELAD